MSDCSFIYVTGLFATAGAAEDGADVTLPLSTVPPANVDDEYSLEDPLLQPTTAEGDIEAAATADEDNPESNIPTTSSSTRDSIIINILKDSRCEKAIILSMLLICFAIAVFSFATNVNDIASDPGFRLDSVTVTSFNVSRNLLETTWDTQLSLNLADGSSADDVRFEAPRLWLYSRDGRFATRTYPSLRYSHDGKKLILHAVFRMQRKVQTGLVVKLGMLMEVNTMRVVHAHGPKVEFRWFVTIDCNGLKIEFDLLNKRYGRLMEDDGGENSCRVQVCTLEWHPLYDGADKCVTSSLPSSLDNYLLNI